MVSPLASVSAFSFESFTSIDQTLNFSGKYNAVQAMTLHRVL